MVMEDNKISYGDHVAAYTNIRTLCCLLEINMLYVNDTSIKNLKIKKKIKE